MRAQEVLDRDLATVSAVLLEREEPPHPPRNPRLRELYDSLVEIRHFALSLSEGDLSPSMGGKGYVAASLKSFQSSLRHFLWQSRMVAEGEFFREVDLPEELPAPFDGMDVSLDDTLARLRERERELRRLSSTDSLTGTNNRRRFLDLLEEEVERSIRYGRPLSLLMIDIDDFKSVNDARGHAAGDVALRSVTSAIGGSGLRTADFLGRLGGEEFAVALPETRCSEAVFVAERIRAAVAETIVTFEESAFRVTVSVGVAEHEGEEPQDRLLKRADQALYEAKRAGRNRVRHR